MSISQIINRKFYLILGIILLANLFSLSGFLVPEFGKISFIFISILILILTLIKLEYGILILFTELFIGSKGYLFSLDLGGIDISIRIAIWLIVMSVWLSQIIIRTLKTKKIQTEFTKSKLFYIFIILSVFILWGLLNGYLNNNTFYNIFFDFNGWLYFALVFPLYDTIKTKEQVFKILQIFSASIVWLCVETFFLLFIFSHNMIGMIFEIYRWIRDTGIGEITQVQGGFYRVFLQSHIFILIFYFIFILFFIYNKKNRLFLYIFLVLLMSVNLLSYSRSNWIGLLLGLILFFIITKIQSNWKKVMKSISVVLSIIFFSFILITIVVKFPYPDPMGGFNTSDLFSQRMRAFSSEAGVSSRWSLLPQLLDEIKKNPVIGSGFGSTVTYVTSDPRVLETSVTGEYTTYAFEWGWLDIWLKLGIFGLVSYLFLIYKIVFRNIKKLIESNEINIINLGLVFGLIIITIVSFFSPYMNHPLGIGYLLISALILKINR